VKGGARPICQARLKNPDQAAGQPPSDAATTAAPTEAPSVATEDMGSASDEQLTQAIDVLRGLVGGRPPRRKVTIRQGNFHAPNFPAVR